MSSQVHIISADGAYAVAQVEAEEVIYVRGLSWRKAMQLARELWTAERIVFHASLTMAMVDPRLEPLFAPHVAQRQPA